VIDFHCHLDLYPRPSETADEVQRRGVGVLSVTTSPSAWVGTSRLAHERSVIRTALGLHPQLASERKHELMTFDRYFDETRFIGEIGLDGSSEFKSTWAQQTQVFEHIVRACSEVGDKVLSIHSRRAATPVLDLLDSFESVRYPILHWFSGSRAELHRAINRGCWFSVGAAMLAGAKGRALVAAMPRDRVLLETDGPFAQLRQAPLQPWDVVLACRSLSDVWSTDHIETERIIRGNENSLLAGDQRSVG
jgi:TatD DNase family protein